MSVGKLVSSLALGAIFAIAAAIPAHADEIAPCFVKPAPITAQYRPAIELKHPEQQSPFVFDDFSQLPRNWQHLLERSSNVKYYEGLSGRVLYEALQGADPEHPNLPRGIRAAGLLDVLAKADSIRLAGNRTVLDYYREIYLIDQDRFKAITDESLNRDIKPAVIAGIFYSREKLSSCMHKPLLGWEWVDAYKTPEDGDLDMTISRCGNDWRVETDVDEAQGVKHAFTEVAPHYASKWLGKLLPFLRGHELTDPRNIRPILAAAGINPHYRMRTQNNNLLLAQNQP